VKGFKRSILINKKGVRELIGLLLWFLAQEEKERGTTRPVAVDDVRLHALKHDVLLAGSIVLSGAPHCA
jgi:hypothetical protein